MHTVPDKEFTITQFELDELIKARVALETKSLRRANSGLYVAMQDAERSWHEMAQSNELLSEVLKAVANSDSLQANFDFELLTRIKEAIK